MSKEEDNDDRIFKRDLLASLPNLRAFAVSLPVVTTRPMTLSRTRS